PRSANKRHPESPVHPRPAVKPPFRSAKSTPRLLELRSFYGGGSGSLPHFGASKKLSAFSCQLFQLPGFHNFRFSHSPGSPPATCIFANAAQPRLFHSLRVPQQNSVRQKTEGRRPRTAPTKGGSMPTPPFLKHSFKIP